MKDPYAPMDDFEKEMMEYTEEGDVTPVTDEHTQKDFFMKVAKNTQRKDQRMNLRMTLRDVQGLKALAVQEGIPYQTLASSIIHKYVDSHLRRR